MVLITILLFLSVLMLLLLYLLYRSIFYSGRTARMTEPYDGLSSPFIQDRRELVKSEIDSLCAHPCEEICIKARDGTKLFGRFYSCGESAFVCIIFHGYKGSSYTEPSGIANRLLERGISVLTAEHRAHGKSGGSCISFGIRESFDCACWCQYFNERFGGECKLALLGISMGGASVLMASELDLPKSVFCIIADCPYSSAKDIIKRVLSNRHLPSRIIYPAVWLSALIFGRFRLGSASVLRAVKNSKLPVLLIHGTADKFVPISMSEEIYAACSSEKAFFKAEGAGHAGSFANDPEKYSSAVLSFIQKATK